jgi:hypothetical protein
MGKQVNNINLPEWLVDILGYVGMGICVVTIFAFLITKGDVDLKKDAEVYTQENYISELRIVNTDLQKDVKGLNNLLCEYNGHQWIFNYYPREKSCLRCRTVVSGFDDDDIQESLGGAIKDLIRLGANK